MTNEILIDAVHQEETRIAIIKNKRLEDYDYEFDAKKPIRGNIYLAKVIRVEPSLQAAFLDYGGNKNAFLPFSEINPDYYQIPLADKEEIKNIDTNEYHRRENFFLREQIKKLQDEVNLLRHQIKEETKEKYSLYKRIKELTSDTLE